MVIPYKLMEPCKRTVGTLLRFAKAIEFSVNVVPATVITVPASPGNPASINEAIDAFEIPPLSKVIGVPPIIAATVPVAEKVPAFASMVTLPDSCTNGVKFPLAGV